MVWESKEICLFGMRLECRVMVGLSVALACVLYAPPPPQFGAECRCETSMPTTTPSIIRTFCTRSRGCAHRKIKYDRTEYEPRTRDFDLCVCVPRTGTRLLSATQREHRNSAFRMVAALSVYYYSVPPHGSGVEEAPERGTEEEEEEGRKNVAKAEKDTISLIQSRECERESRGLDVGTRWCR